MRRGEETHRDKEVGHTPLVLEPGVAILGAAAADITRGTMGNHAAEEERVKPREGAPTKKEKCQYDQDNG